MKTYDVTIRLRVVELPTEPGKYKDQPPIEARMQQAARHLAQHLAGDATHRALELRQVEVIDHDSLPQPATVCARCASEVRT